MASYNNRLNHAGLRRRREIKRLTLHAAPRPPKGDPRAARLRQREMRACNRATLARRWQQATEAQRYGRVLSAPHGLGRPARVPVV